MRRGRLTVLLAGAAALAWAAPAAGAPQRLVLDAQFTRESTAGPPEGHVGHRQIAAGVLSDAAGHRVGNFGFTCTTTRRVPGDDALERCAGDGRTPDGRFDVAGPGQVSRSRLAWRLAAGGARFRGARGTFRLRQLSDTEWLATATVRTRPGVALRVGVVPALGRDRPFARRADRLCRGASRQLAALPPFPFGDFDPLHPDPALLPAVGAYFTGPRDPRPTLTALTTRLHALGRPVAAAAWRRVLRAETAGIAVRTQQDDAALAADVAAFVGSVHATEGAARELAIAASVFGATSCS
jgi:hypothetical protein